MSYRPRTLFSGRPTSSDRNPAIDAPRPSFRAGRRFRTAVITIIDPVRRPISDEQTKG
jgi:hypothetical protein